MRGCTPSGSAAIALIFSLAALFLSADAQAQEFGLFFGNGGVVDAPAPKLPADGKQLAVEFRFKALAAAQPPARLVSQWSDDPKAADGGAFHIDLLQSNQVAFTLRLGKGRTDTVTSQGNWTPHAWHHVMATWDGSTATLYLDGKSVGTKKVEGAAVPVSALPLTIGQPAPVGRASARAAAAPPSFKGFIADVAIWSAVPGVDVIAQRAGAKDSVGTGEAGLAAHVKLREAAMPLEPIKENVSGQEAKLSPALARTGWSVTPMWDQPAPERPHLHVFSYDLSTAATPAAPVTAGAAPAKTDAGADAITAETPALSNPIRMILLQNPKTQQFGVLWQDKASGGIFITWINTDLAGHETHRLKSMEDGQLAAGCTDPTGNVIYVEIQKHSGNGGGEGGKPLLAFLHAAGPTGKALGEVPLDTTADGENGLNVWKYGGRWGGSMAYANKSIGLILPRTMYRSADGLNHQGAIAVVFAAGNPANYKNLGQVSGHSFGNEIRASATGEFIGMDLGDCYPRGINLTKFTSAGMASRVVFTYKTEHATSPSNNSPKYDEISTPEKTFYKWSNDNNTYTELGGAIEGRSSYSVIFSTDRSVEGKVLDNSRAFSKCDDPRDLAMVRIVRNFDQVKSSNEVSDALLAGGPPDGSTSETGGFFNFVGNWTKQRQAGVIWLTHHKSGESARAPHPVRLADGNILILWEKTSAEGPSLCATKVSEAGKILGEATLPGSKLRLSREDKFLSTGGRNFVLATDPASGAVRLCFVYDDLPAVAGETESKKPVKR